MTSKPQSTTTPKPSQTLADVISAALVSYEFNDAIETGITVNVTDALMAIANAINRLAAVQEAATARAAQMAEVVSDLKAISDSIDTGPGHA